MGKWKLIAPLLIVGIILSACPIKNVPEIGEAETAISAAKDADAAKYAPTKLKAAEEALAAAKAARQNRDYNEAVAQAELAKRLANEARAEALEAAAREAPARIEEPPPPAAVDEVDYSKIFKNVYFDFDRHDVKPEYRSELDGAASYMKGHDNVKVTVYGHCDPRGTDDYNLALGERRANSVEQYLVNSGVSARRISSISKGESELLDPSCSSENCWWKERRAVFTVQD